VFVYALTSSKSLHETLDLFLTREADESELREVLEDEPDWKDILRAADRARRAEYLDESGETKPGRGLGTGNRSKRALATCGLGGSSASDPCLPWQSRG
jgi:hypothetical protein